MEDLIDPAVPHAFWVNALALLFGIILPLPAAGLLSDKCGRQRTMIVGAGLTAVLGPVMIVVIASGEFASALVAQIALGLMLTLFGGPMNAWLVERFPPEVRLTSAAFGYDLAHCTASAFSPLIATVLVKDFGTYAPGAIYPFFAVLAVAGMFVSQKFHTDGGMDGDADSYKSQEEAKVDEEENSENKLNPIT